MFRLAAIGKDFTETYISLYLTPLVFKLNKKIEIDQVFLLQ